MNEFERRSLHFLESIDTLLKVLIVEVRKVQPAAERNYSPPLPSRYGRRAIDAGLRG
jgi:hypothetical protein